MFPALVFRFKFPFYIPLGRNINQMYPKMDALGQTTSNVERQTLHVLQKNSFGQLNVARIFRETLKQYKI